MIIQWLAKKLVIWSFYLIKLDFLAMGLELLMSFHPYYHLAPNDVRLEASKKLVFVHVPQGAAKLRAVKVLVFQKIKSVHRWHCFHMKI